MKTIRYYEPVVPWQGTIVREMELPATIIFTGDWHIGNGGTDHELLERDLKRMGEMENTYTVLMGDLIENAIKSAPGGTTQEQVMRVSEQKEWAKIAVTEWLGGNVIGIIQGNHEERSYTVDDFEVNKWLTEEVNKETSCGAGYMGAGSKIILKTSVGDISIIAAHVFRGGSYNPLNAFRKMYTARGPAKILALAHYHFPGMWTEILQEDIRFYLRCGTYETHGRYSMKFGLDKSRSEMPAVYIDEKGNVIPYMDFKQLRTINK